MSDILERQLKEYYGLWNQTNALYTRWAKDHGMTCDALFVLYAILPQITFIFNADFR